jgi:hypothetical protein
MVFVDGCTGVKSLDDSYRLWNRSETGLVLLAGRDEHQLSDLGVGNDQLLFFSIQNQVCSGIKSGEQASRKMPINAVS